MRRPLVEVEVAPRAFVWRGGKTWKAGQHLNVKALDADRMARRGTVQIVRRGRR